MVAHVILPVGKFFNIGGGWKISIDTEGTMTVDFELDPDLGSDNLILKTVFTKDMAIRLCDFLHDHYYPNGWVTPDA